MTAKSGFDDDARPGKILLLNQGYKSCAEDLARATTLARFFSHSLQNKYTGGGTNRVAVTWRLLLLVWQIGSLLLTKQNCEAGEAGAVQLDTINCSSKQRVGVQPDGHGGLPAAFPLLHAVLLARLGGGRARGRGLAPAPPAAGAGPVRAGVVAPGQPRSVSFLLGGSGIQGSFAQLVFAKLPKEFGSNIVAIPINKKK